MCFLVFGFKQELNMLRQEMRGMNFYYNIKLSTSNGSKICSVEVKCVGYIGINNI